MLMSEDVGAEEGTRVVFKLIFPDTRAGVGEGGRGKWIDKPLGVTTVGGDGEVGGDERKTLAEARFVIGDYVACAIYPPGARDVPTGRMAGARGPRENGFGGRGGGRGGFGGAYGGRGGMMGAPPPGDWRRGERPPGGGYGGGMYNGGGGYRGGRGGRY